MVSRILASCLFVALLTVAFLSLDVQPVHGFIVFLGNTTACDFCDEYQTYSGR